MRHSLKEGGAPAGILYIDAHELAGSKGNVTKVLFYVDQTCAMATIELGAFHLIDRNVEMNKARLALTYSSGPLKIYDTKQLKSYMHPITIELCHDRGIGDMDNDPCQGHQFPVLPDQYFGIRSDTCRFGYASTQTDLTLATTWVSSVLDWEMVIIVKERL